MESLIGVPVILVLRLIEVLPRWLEARDARIDGLVVRIAAMGTLLKSSTGSDI